ncbi:VC0807 family protein [Saccharopolyspora sp. ID03-671]|uniref:VC0807 family protein n=1 Tax=Saccharopolyspora sp. ID03-671 TaxID=3073066 RepID=UPI00324C03D3
MKDDLRPLLRRIGPDLLGPVAVYYLARIAGLAPTASLLLAAAVPVIRAARSYVTDRRVGGVTLFVLGAVALSAVMSLVTGDPRLLLVRAAWGTAALGILLLATLFARRPLLYSAAAAIFDDQRGAEWAANWERYPAFRRVLWSCTAFWGAMFLLDAAGRVVMALTLPVDVVPLLDDVLLVVVVVLLLAFQRIVGRRMLRNAGLRLSGTTISAV